MFILGDTIKFRTDIEGSQTLSSGFHIDISSWFTLRVIGIKWYSIVIG